jgi:hypothetical protein
VAPEGRPISGLWIDVVLPLGSTETIALVNMRSVAFEVTGWGLRVPLPQLIAGDTARISFVVEAEPGALAPR